MTGPATAVFVHGGWHDGWGWHLVRALLDTRGVRVMKARGHGLKLEIDTALIPLEPVIAAIMQRCHIVDMTIADPPMEEIIADIYGQKRATESAAPEQAVAKRAAPALETGPSSTHAGG